MFALLSLLYFCFFFFFNDTATTEIYTLSLHDALPISPSFPRTGRWRSSRKVSVGPKRSEEHTSELQSRSDLVCRLLLEKKKNHNNKPFAHADRTSPATLPDIARAQ